MSSPNRDSFERSTRWILCSRQSRNIPILSKQALPSTKNHTRILHILPLHPLPALLAPLLLFANGPVNAIALKRGPVRGWSRSEGERCINRCWHRQWRPACSNICLHKGRSAPRPAPQLDPGVPSGLVISRGGRTSQPTPPSCHPLAPRIWYRKRTNLAESGQ